MLNTELEFHQRFLDIFTIAELNDIVDNAMVVTQNRIIISTKDNFFELSADMGDSLDIYCNDNKNNTGSQLTKEEFMKLFKSSPLMEMPHINIGEEI